MVEIEPGGGRALNAGVVVQRAASSCSRMRFSASRLMR
jgi:hypothetical protein